MNSSMSGTHLAELPIRKRSHVSVVVQEDLETFALNNDGNSALEEEEPEYVGGTQDIYSLPYFQASLFATILEDTIMEMRILVESNSELGLSKARVDLNNLRALKFNINQPLVTDELDGINVRQLNCVEYKVNKLDADRKSLQYAFLEFYLDLSLSRTFKTLAAKNHGIVDKINHYESLLEEEANNRTNRRELCRQLRQRRNYIKTVFYDTDCIIEELKTEVEDAAVNAQIQKRYVENWQRARTEQNNQLIRTKEAGPCNVIEYFKQRYDHEQRVHTEVELLTTIKINETLEKVEKLMSKYDVDMEAIDIKIQRMKNKHINTLEKRQGLEETIEKHAQLIKDWVDFKNARERDRLYREKMTNAAIVVQAWWRGLLVRNQLGPYKPQPKKKGKKK